MIKVKIGIDAGNIWQILNKKGSVKIIDLKKITKLDIKDIYILLWVGLQENTKYNSPKWKKNWLYV